MKKEIIFTLALFFTIIGCEKENNNPEQSRKVLHLDIFYGDGQSGVYNCLLNDSLVVKVTDHKGNPVPKTPVRFELKKGNGDISPDWTITDSSGIAYAYWSIGCDGNNNELIAFLTDSISNIIDSVTFTANGNPPNGWGKSCGIENVDQFRSIFREHNGTIYFTYYDEIYTSTDGINWLEYDIFPPLSTNTSIFDIRFNSKGWMYIATDEGIFYKNNTNLWYQINNETISIRYPISFLVEDNCLFISLKYNGLYRSTDNGQNWEKLLINGDYRDEYAFINRHPNGDLYLFDKWNDLWKSSDNGDSWSNIDLNYKYTKRVKDFKIDKNGTLYIGSDDATISIVSSETYQGTSYSYYKPNSTTQYVVDIKIINGIVFFTVDGSPEPGIYSSKNWNKLDLGFEDKIHNYHLKTDGTFLIASSEGVYYYNK